MSSASSLIRALLLLMVATGCERVADLSALTSGGSTTKAQTVPMAAADFAARVESGAPLMIVNLEERDALTTFALVTDRNGDRTWRTQDNVTLSTRSGLLTSTRALGADLMSADVMESEALVLADRAGLAVRIHRYLDGQNGIEIDSYVCEITPFGRQDLTLDGRTVQTRVLTEACTNPDNDFENSYWVSGGRVVQSRQWVGPDVGAIAMREVFR